MSSYIGAAMYNLLVFLGLILSAVIVLFSLIHVAGAYLLVMLAVAVWLIAVGIPSWRNI